MQLHDAGLRRCENCLDINPISSYRVTREFVSTLCDWCLIGDFKTRTDLVGDCWVWNGPNRSGYPQSGHGAVHRVIYELHHQVSLEPWQVIHHKCGTSMCINLEHLQMTDTHSNNAEMLERNYYLGRIAALEAALAELDPSHRILTRSFFGPANVEGIQP